MAFYDASGTSRILLCQICKSTHWKSGLGVHNLKETGKVGQLYFFTSQIFNKVDEQVLFAALQELQESIGNDINNLYVTRNRSFGVDMDYAVLSNTRVKELLEERGLPKSGDGQGIRARLTEFDAAEGDVARYELIPTAGLACLRGQVN